MLDTSRLADLLIWWVVPLAVSAAALSWVHTVRGGRSARAGRAVGVLLVVVPVVVALGTFVQVVLIGHSGAKAAWHDAAADPAADPAATAPLHTAA